MNRAATVESSVECADVVCGVWNATGYGKGAVVCATSRARVSCVRHVRVYDGVAPRAVGCLAVC